jgi:hypothetical protein
MPTIIVTPITNMMPLVMSLVRVDSNEAASAKIAAKKKTTVTAMAPNTVTIFTVTCGVTSHNLILPFKYAIIFQFSTYTFLIRLVYVTIYGVKNQVKDMSNRLSRKAFLKCLEAICEEDPAVRYQNPDS